MTVSDNGISLPEDINARSIKSLGLRLVKLLAESQLNSTIEVAIKKSTTYHIVFETNIPLTD